MWRVIVGGVLLMAGLYVVVGEHLVGVSADATVNARLTTLRAPIDGTLSLTVKKIGARLSKGERLGEVEDNRADTTRLADLQRIEASLRADANKIEKQKHNVIAARLTLVGHAEEYRQGRISQLQARLSEAKAAIDAANARYRESEGTFVRAKDLSSRGVQTAANFDKAQSGYEISLQDIEVAKQKVAYLNIELEAARNGTYLGDSYNDAPYSLQRIRELDLRLSEMDTDLAFVRERQAQVLSQVSEERIRLSLLTGAEIATSARGIVWDYLANNGETVRKGQDLLRIVDCDTVMVTASVSERLYNRLKTGDAAQFRLLGDEKIYEATIARLAGSGALTRYDKLAIGVTPEHLTRYDVTLSAPAFTEDAGVGCAVGRTGRVVFSEGPLSGVRRLLLQVGW